MPGILVVEDDENLNRGITFSLKKSGYEVFSAEEGADKKLDYHRALKGAFYVFTRAKRKSYTVV